MQAGAVSSSGGPEAQGAAGSSSRAMGFGGTAWQVAGSCARYSATPVPPTEDVSDVLVRGVCGSTEVAGAGRWCR